MITKQTEMNLNDARIELPKIEQSGMLWRAKDQMTIWVVADNGLMYIHKQEFEKRMAYPLHDGIKAKGTINPINWNKVGFVRVMEKVEVAA